jgi:intracellular sulfur oxidation DsrE/DsrF family protein
MPRMAPAQAAGGEAPMRYPRARPGAGVLLFVLAAVATAADFPAEDPKPFAEARVVLQLSDADPKKQSAVLDVANNLIKHYGGPELVDIEIIAFGPGIELLFAGSPLSERIASLVVSEVRFVACMNTVDTIERLTGKRPVLTEHAIPVQTGVAHVVERARSGYVLVRP